MMKFISALSICLALFSCVGNKDQKELIEGINIGNIAPELSYPSVNGDTLKLSSLRGSVVLIDFWASWCRPCRWENRNLIQTVKTFENKDFPNGKNWIGQSLTSKGLKVFSVSLDQNKASWERAIKQDKLDWIWHISDLKGWRSDPAKIYSVSSIPTNFLIDANGIIIGINLRGNSLDQALEKHSIKTKGKEK